QLKLPPIEYISREESLAIETNEFLNGTKAYDLMLAAGKAIATHVKQINPSNILILCGSGNNGGDGIVAANLLSPDFRVTLVLIKKPKTAEAIQAYHDLNKKRVKIVKINKNTKVESIYKLMENSDLIIDSLIGIGLKSTVKGTYQEIINKFSELHNTHICSVDIPSGLDCNTGEWLCTPYAPSSVVTMEFLKAGLQTLDPNCDIKVAPIGISVEAGHMVGKGHFIHFWPKRALSSHKGENGRIIVIGGSDGFPGAPVLSGMSALRTGVDTLRIAVPETIRNIVAGFAKDFIILKVKGDKITSKGFNRFKDLTVNRHDVVTVGMGLSNHPECIKFVLELFEHVKGKIKIVLDADAIRAFKGKLDLLKGSGAIITPHRAELRMMLEQEIPEDPQDLITFLEAIALDLGIVI
ncbi:MAG: NAD(P)H-hydrate epimerase, partial [Candidatus Heimdallarchaeota archaeon]